LRFSVVFSEAVHNACGFHVKGHQLVGSGFNHLLVLSNLEIINQSDLIPLALLDASAPKNEFNKLSLLLLKVFQHEVNL